MKIVVVNQHLADKMGGSEVQCDLLATGMFERGHHVVYISPGGNADRYDRPYKVIACGTTGDDISRAVQAVQPDIIYWRFNKNSFLRTMRKIRALKIPVIFAASSVNDVHPFFTDSYLRIDKRLKQLIRSCRNHLGMWYVDAVTVNNQVYLGKLPVTRQEFIPNGMSTEVDSFKWKRPYCCWVSNIKRKKRPELAVALARELDDLGVDVLMVGDIQEELYNWLKDEEKTPDNFYYLGPKSLNQVNGLLKESLLHIHTCYPEGFPNVFIQSWLQGTPSVSYGFDPGGYLESEQLGRCANENSDRFIKCIRDYITNKELRNEAGNRARQFANELFSTEKFVDRVEVLMTDLLENRTG